MVTTYCIIFLGSITVCALLSRALRDVALSGCWPAARLEGHVKTLDIPPVGGTAIFSSLALTVGIVGICVFCAEDDFGLPSHCIAGVMSAITIVFLLGLYDDFHGVGAFLKFAIQTAAASLVFCYDLRVTQLPLLFGDRSLGVLASWAGTVFFMLLLTNALTALDGLDGLAAGSALFPAITIFASCLWNGRLFTAMVALALAGAIFGFLRYNFNPATVYLGNSGSLFVGFTLGVLALLETQKASTIVEVAIPVISFGFPILGTCVSMLRRIIGGQRLFRPDCEHIRQKLLQKGFSQRQAAVLLYGVSAVFGLCSALFRGPAGPTMGLVLFVLTIGIWLGIQYLGYPEFLEMGRIVRRTVEQKQVIINNLALRRAAERLSLAQSFADVCQILREALDATDFACFEIRYIGSGEQISRSELENRALLYQWEKLPGGNKSNSSQLWNLTFDLSNAQERKSGHFAVYQQYGRRSLLVDVNLLIVDLRVELNSALNRVATVSDSVARGMSMQKARFAKSVKEAVPLSGMPFTKGLPQNQPREKASI